MALNTNFGHILNVSSKKFSDPSFWSSAFDFFASTGALGERRFQRGFRKGFRKGFREDFREGF